MSYAYYSFIIIVLIKLYFYKIVPIEAAIMLNKAGFNEIRSLIYTQFYNITSKCYVKTYFNGPCVYTALAN